MLAICPHCSGKGCKGCCKSGQIEVRQPDPAAFDYWEDHCFDCQLVIGGGCSPRGQQRVGATECPLCGGPVATCLAVEATRPSFRP